MAAAFSESLPLHPAVAAVAGDELDPEFQPRVERFQVAPRVAVHEPAAPGHGEPPAPQQPLVGHW